MKTTAPGDSAAVPGKLVAGNYFDKYRTRNPLYQILMAQFLNDARTLFQLAKPRRVLEVGCGSGDLAARLLGPVPSSGDQKPVYLGTDISDDEIAHARALYPGRRFQTASVYSLPFPDRSFDLVIACEVLEHVEFPDQALREINRVCGGHVLASVPWEPWWRILNVLRGKYVKQWGNTPGHIMHYSFKGFCRMLATHFDRVEIRRPFPWSMILARTRAHGQS